MSRRTYARNKVNKASKKAHDKSTAKMDRKAKASKSKKAVNKEGETRIEQGHRMNEIIAKGPVSIKQLTEKTGYSEARVQNHVEFFEERGQLRTDRRGRVHLTDKPIRRRNRS